MTEPPPPPSEALWYYMHGTQRLGPVPTSTMAGMVRTGALPLSTMVWRDGMSDWQMLSAVPEFTGVAGGPNAVVNILRDPREVALGLTMPGLIIFIVLLLMCLPLCWLPWVIDDLHVKKNV